MWRNRNVRSSVAGGGLPAVDDDKIEVADIDHKAQRLARDEDRVSAVERVDQQQRAAADREEPERDRNDASAGALGRDPLYHEAHGEESLRHESEQHPGVELDDEDVMQIVENISHQPSPRSQSASVSCGGSATRRRRDP